MFFLFLLEVAYLSCQLLLEFLKNVKRFQVSLIGLSFKLGECIVEKHLNVPVRSERGEPLKLLEGRLLTI